MVRRIKQPMPENAIRLPSMVACKLCTYFISDWCDECLDHDMEHFTINDKLGIENTPRYPTKEMQDYPAHVRLMVLSFYMERIVDLLR